MSSNLEATLELLYKATLHEEVMKYLSELLPEWTEHVVEQYAPEYLELEKTWDEICKKVNTDKAKILIVRYLPMKMDNDNDRYIGTIADILVSKGYLLRRSSELIVCPNTGYAIVSKKMFEYFKRHNNIFPEKWYPHALSVSDSSTQDDGALGSNGRASLESTSLESASLESVLLTAPVASGSFESEVKVALDSSDE
jgi:hypothetical protein